MSQNASNQYAPPLTRTDPAGRGLEKTLGPFILHFQPVPVMAAALAGFAIVPFGIVRVMREEGRHPIGIGISVAIGVAMLVTAFILWRVRTIFHERGVARLDAFGERLVPYEDVESFSLKIVDSATNGLSGTRIEAVLRPCTGRLLRMVGRYHAADQKKWETIREKISTHVADRLYERLHQTGSVAWTKRIRFTLTGVRFRRLQSWGRGPEMELPYPSSPGPIQKGSFTLYKGGKVVFTMKCGDENFYPGLMLFQRLCRETNVVRAK